MATTFESRKLVRDELVALFVATGSWSEVFGYNAGVNAFGAQTPILTITSTGTALATETADSNPTSYGFLITNYVLSYRVSDGWEATDAMDTLDALDLVIRQTIFNNIGGGTNYNYLQIDPSSSTVGEGIREGLVYMVEERTIFAHLPTGHKI